MDKGEPNFYGTTISSSLLDRLSSGMKNTTTFKIAMKKTS
jgi:hypothetical protein